MRTVPAGEFKTHCLALLKEVSQKQNTIVVTKHGKPIAQVVPFKKKKETYQNPLQNCIVFEKNIIDPLDVEWEADQ